MTDPAAALLELARAERRLVGEGRYEELAGVQAERERVLAVLPAHPAPGEAAVLASALAVQAEVADMLRTTRDAVAAELERLDRGRATLRGYAPAGLDPARSFDSAA